MTDTTVRPVPHPPLNPPPAAPVEGMMAPCPVCNSYTVLASAGPTTLVAVCDVLVYKALEQIGKRIVRAGRERYRALGTHPWHEAHTIWPPVEGEVTKGLKGAWDVVPAMLDAHGCCGVTSRQVQDMLDQYVRDLVITGTTHTLDKLEYRFVTRLNLPVKEAARA